jgi:hypothetical protein
MSEGSTEPQLHPLDEPAPAPDYSEQEQTETPVRRKRGLGSGRHATSVVLSFAGVLVGYGALDFGFFRASRHFLVEANSGRIPDETAIALGVAALGFLVATAAGRISALGPLLAGLVLGVAPSVWVYLDYGSYVRRLDDFPELWDNTTFGLSGLAFAIFPAVAGLMLGAAAAGRWRRHHPAP